MAYPGTVNNLTGVTDKIPGGASGTEWKAATVNPWVAEINAITVELGANPKGAYADVDARLDAIEGSANGGIPKIDPAVAGNFPKQKADGTLEDSGADAADFATAGHDHDSAYISIVGTPTAGNLPALTAGGELTDSGSKPADFAAAGHNHSGVYDPAGTAATAITNHEAAADPHTGYQKETEKGAASGYASLNASALVVENPANAQTTPAASKIPLADGTGKIATGWTPAMIGATSGAAGAAGLVPAPAAGDQDKVLCGGGTWVTPAGGGGDNVSVNGTACSDMDLDDDGVTATAGRALMEWKTSGSAPTKVNCQTPASVPVVLDREFAISVGTSYTAVLTYEVPAGAMGTTRALRFTIYGWFANLSGTSGTISLQIKFGSTTLWEGTTISISSSTAYRSFCIQGVLVNANANNSQRLGGQMIFTTNTADPTTGYGSIGSGMSGGSFRGTSSESTTSAKTLLVNLKKTVSGTFDFTVDHALLELV